MLRCDLFAPVVVKGVAAPLQGTPPVKALMIITCLLLPVCILNTIQTQILRHYFLYVRGGALSAFGQALLILDCEQILYCRHNVKTHKLYLEPLVIIKLSNRKQEPVCLTAWHQHPTCCHTLLSPG